jgi:hypothetical protein
LHANRRNFFAFRAFERIARCQIIWMQVVRNRLRLNAEQALEMLDAILERFQRLVIFQVTNVMTETCIAVTRDAKSVFQFCASCE